MTAGDYSDAGAFNVDGQWATAIRFEAALAADGLSHVRLRFMNGRSEVAKADLAADVAQRVLGAENYGRILEAAGEAQGSGVAHGELSGSRLTFREVTLSSGEPAPANTVEGEQKAAAASMGADLRPAAEEGAPAVPQEATGADDAERRRDAVPPWVRERFLSDGKRYYFPDGTLAFTDHGMKLRAESHNVEVVRGVLAIAGARGWTSIRVSGSEEFRRAVWKQAMRAGMEVRGYEPGEAERARGRDEAAAQPGSAGARGHAEAPAATKPAAATAAAPRRIAGILLEAGAAPYRLDPTKGLSYYVKLRTPHGERTLWGADLERAIVESATRVKVGDAVEIENQGSRPVTVKELRRGDDGKVVDVRVAAQRQRWLVEKAGYFQERAARAAAFRRTAGATGGEASRHPEVTAAVVRHWLCEQLASRHVERPPDRARVIEAARERIASALERGHDIPVPRLRMAAEQRLASARRSEAAQLSRTTGGRRPDASPTRLVREGP